MAFTNDWFLSGTLPVWERWGVDRYNVDRYLEVGVCEGAAMRWVADTLLPTRMVAVDNWSGRPKHQSEFDKYRSNFYSNMQDEIRSGLLIVHEEDSHSVLPVLTDPFDLIYVDGDHTGYGCMLDLINSYKLLRAPDTMMQVEGVERLCGGIMVVDDLNRIYNRFPEVKIAVHQFEFLMHGRVARLWQDQRQCAFVRLR